MEFDDWYKYKDKTVKWDFDKDVVEKDEIFYANWKNKTKTEVFISEFVKKITIKSFEQNTA